MSIFSKGATTRLTETKAYLLNDVPPPERVSVRAYIDQSLSRMTEVGGNLRQLSETMSMRDEDTPGTADERKKRRSLILMAFTRANGLTREAVIALTGAGLGDAYFASLRNLRLLADQETGGGTLIADRFTALMTNPSLFLANNYLFTRGSTTDGLMDQYFFFEMRNGRGSYSIVSGIDAHPLRAMRVPVISVPAVVWSAVPGRGTGATLGSFGGIRGTELVGASLMITTQFSGCAFCVKRITASGRVFAAHIMPGLESVPGSDLTGGGKELAEQLAGTKPTVGGGDFAPPGDGAGTFQVYGARYSNIGPHTTGGYDSHQSMTLIGVRGGTGWTFHSQMAFNTTVTSTLRLI